MYNHEKPLFSSGLHAHYGTLQQKANELQSFAHKNLGIYAHISPAQSYLLIGGTVVPIEMGVITYNLDGREIFIKINNGIIIENSGVIADGTPIIMYAGRENIIDGSGQFVDHPLAMYFSNDDHFECLTVKGQDNPFSYVHVVFYTRFITIAAKVHRDMFNNPYVIRAVTNNSVTGMLYRDFLDNSARLIAVLGDDPVLIHRGQPDSGVSSNE